MAITSTDSRLMKSNPRKAPLHQPWREHLIYI